MHTPITDLENAFLKQFYDPSPQSDYFYRVSRISIHDRYWVPKHKYASSTLQSIRTRGHFANAFTHRRGTDLWGWKSGYLTILRKGLTLNAQRFRGKGIPAFDLAVWLSREENWLSDTKPKQLIDWLISSFGISKEELGLFDTSIAKTLTPVSLFQEIPLGWNEIREVLGPPPPDAKPERGGGLTSLSLEGVGPAKKLTLEPADRVTLITGDNGLGKTFLLECAWWALTGDWAGSPVLPLFNGKGTAPKLTFQISSKKSPGPKTTVSYDSKVQAWSTPRVRPTIPGLIVYARVDGSFAVWDPAKPRSLPNVEPPNPSTGAFSKEQVWDGLGTQIEGLVRDWVKWQSNPQKYPFDTLKRVLARMSPPDLGVLQPGEPVRLPHDSRDIPTLIHRYGEIPIIHASAGVRRIIGLTYLIVWAWYEHNVYSRLANRQPEDRMVILIDEIEAHLHPKWQRAVLPAAIDIRGELSEKLQVQMLVTTHSPMTMASMEPFFDEKSDKLYHLDLTESGEVKLKEQPFIRHGSIGAWLTSEIFELRHARSREAERAIEKAKELQTSKSPPQEDVDAISKELIKYLASDDEFWPRWLFFAEKHGVKL
ncbi:MAG TPA: AAA family ATPase [Burkholderiales bacterium]|nr:AAA family ATPase [Burkholderiales bacterium]